MQRTLPTYLPVNLSIDKVLLRTAVLRTAVLRTDVLRTAVLRTTLNAE